MSAELCEATRRKIENTIRGLTVDAVEAAGIGHLGAPLGLARPVFQLWDQHLRFDPADPGWPLRDRFVLSAGHASMLLYALLLWRAFAIARRGLAQGHRFAALLAQGIGILLILQAAVHIGVNTGLLPTKGLTLPLLSYGGSSLLSSMAAVGLLFAADRETRATPSKAPKSGSAPKSGKARKSRRAPEFAVTPETVS